MNMFTNTHLETEMSQFVDGVQDQKIMLTYRAPGTNANSKLFPYEGVVDLLRNVMKGLSIIRTGEKEKRDLFASHVTSNVKLYIKY